jgi:hypothetical protein
MSRRILETEQKALEINLDDRIYGAFAEIGAGQEVARHFFQVGAAAGTVAKTMSAYDKTVSDDIYGVEEKGRYVCEARLYKMLQHEFELLEERLRPVRPLQNLFVFADTVSAINFQKTIKGDGWLGVRFQMKHDTAPNDLVVHVRLLDNDNRLQQQAIGILGVNLIYGCHRFANDPEMMLQSFMDNLHGRVMIDMVRLTGPDFAHLDNRLLTLWIVKNGLSLVSIFGADARPLHASEFLYKKSILIARGSYRPPTLVQEDMITHSYQQFKDEAEVDADKAYFLTEITIDNLRSDGDLNEKDYLDRVELLCALKQTVVISSCVQHKKLIQYFSDYKVQRIGLVMGVRKLLSIISETFQNNQDNLLGAFGELFPRNVRFYIYPARQKDNTFLTSAHNMDIPQPIHFLYQYLLENGNIVDVNTYNEEILHIYHKKVLTMIQTGETGWEQKVPEGVAKVIKEKSLFGYKAATFEAF